MRHFLDLKYFSVTTLQGMLETAQVMKLAHVSGVGHAKHLAGKSVAMIFEKPSTRTRVSFELGVTQLGGTPVILSAQDLQLCRGETVEDTVKVLSRYVDAIMIRCISHQTLMAWAKHATVPVINGLTDRSHPCQLMADLRTMIDYHGVLAGQTVAWLGDGNNVATSWVEAAVLFGFQLRIACPNGYEPPAEVLAWAGANGGDIVLTKDVLQAVDKAQTVVTDVWASMGQESDNREKDLSPYQVNETVMRQAAENAIFMHCLPARREMEVTSGVMDGHQSVVFDEAENRLHAQKAILAWCITGNRVK